MTLPKIVKLPNPILAKKLNQISKEEIIENDIKALAEQMHKDMIEAKGVGLAANQVNQDLALFVIDKTVALENEVPDAFINPEITEYSKDQDEMEEGCLSIPEFYTPILRSKKIMFKAQDLDGNKIN